MQGFKDLTKWVDEVRDLCQPDSVYWVTGSKKEEKEFYEMLVSQQKAIQLNPLLSVDKHEWLDEVESIRLYYQTLGSKLPKCLLKELDMLKDRLEKMV